MISTTSPADLSGKTNEENGLSCYKYITLNEFTHLAVLPSLFMILFLSLFEKRKNTKRWKWFNGRPGLLVPVNLLDGDEDRLAYAAAFGSTATNCVTIIHGHFVPEDCPIWFELLYAMLAVIEMSIDYYLLFACLSKKNSLLDCIIGLGYSIMWFLVNLAHVFDCSEKSELVFRSQPLVIQLPVLVCLLYVICVFMSRVLTVMLKFLVKMFTGQLFESPETNSIVQMLKAIDSQVEPGLNKYQIRHVKELLKGKQSSLPSLAQLEKLNGSIWSIIRYRHDPSYRFSIRVTSAFTATLLCLYEFALLSFLVLDKTLNTAEKEINKINNIDLIKVFGEGVLTQVDLLFKVVRACWYASYGISSVVMVNYVIKIFLNYRMHSCRLMRGDYSFIPDKVKRMSKGMVLGRSLTYSGSQVAYILWGYYFTILMLFILFMIISYFIVLPFLNKVNYEFLFIFWTVAPSVTMSYMAFYTLKFLSGRIFLQKCLFMGSDQKLQQTLALDNRRVYHVVSYFLFFFYAFVGLIKAVARSFIGIILGVAYLSRMDRCDLLPGFENSDPGYLSYLCVLQVEMVHCHPVLVSFCHILKDTQQYNSLVRHVNIQTDNDFAGRSTRLRKRLNINRWLKCYTLIKNPTLVNKTAEKRS